MVQDKIYRKSEQGRSALGLFGQVFQERLWLQALPQRALPDAQVKLQSGAGMHTLLPQVLLRI